TWKDGRLQRFDSKTNDDGKGYNVTASLKGQNLEVQVNGQKRVVAAGVWATTYWQQPPGQPHAQPMVILDADTGDTIASKLYLIGLEQLVVAGKPLNCTHYRVTSGMQAELWYDGQGRLVREEAVNDGHRTTLELK